MHTLRSNYSLERHENFTLVNMILLGPFNISLVGLAIHPIFSIHQYQTPLNSKHGPMHDTDFKI